MGSMMGYFKPIGVKKTTWKKGNKTIIGEWQYLGNDKFRIRLDSKDPITGQDRWFTVHGDEPNFNGWVMVNQ